LEKKTEDYLNEDILRLELGAGLVSLVDPKRGSDIMKRITAVRTELASDLGILLPMVRIRDRLNLPSFTYEISLQGNIVADGTLVPERLLAVATRERGTVLDGDPAKDPATGRTAYWIEPELRTVAERQGYRVHECSQVIANHLSRIAEEHAAELLSREVTKQLIDQVRKTHATVVDELIPQQLKLSEVQQVLRNLLDEGVPIRPLSVILEALGDVATDRKDIGWVTERVRERLGRTLCHRHRDPMQRLFAITLDPSIEDAFAATLDAPARHGVHHVSPTLKRALVEQLRETLPDRVWLSKSVVLMVNPEIRALMRRTLKESFPRLSVLSTAEITADTQVESIAILEFPQSDLVAARSLRAV
jgi:flagellar biosynthesis protein FlhA